MVLFCHITTQIEGEKYGDLLDQKGGTGFPYLVYMDSDGNVIAEHDGARTVAAFEKTLARAQVFMEVKKKAEAGDRAAKIDYLLARLELGHVKVEEARALLKDLGELTKDQQSKLDGAEGNELVRELQKTLKKDDPAPRLEAGKKCLERKQAGKAPPTGTDEFWRYWLYILHYAQSQKDLATMEEGIKTLREKYGDNARAMKRLEQEEEALRKLKEEMSK